MIPQEIIDAINSDIDHMIENMESEVSLFEYDSGKSRIEFENKIDFLCGVQIGKVWRLFSTLMPVANKTRDTLVTETALAEFSEILFGRASEIREAILKTL